MKLSRFFLTSIGVFVLVFALFFHAPKAQAAWWPSGMWPGMKFSWGTATWQMVPEAKGYNLYYKEAGQMKWTHAVAHLPWNSTSYNIMYLKPGVKYSYRVAALNAKWAEFWWSSEKWLTTQMMPSTGSQMMTGGTMMKQY